MLEAIWLLIYNFCKKYEENKWAFTNPLIRFKSILKQTVLGVRAQGHCIILTLSLMFPSFFRAGDLEDSPHQGYAIWHIPPGIPGLQRLRITALIKHILSASQGCQQQWTLVAR